MAEPREWKKAKGDMYFRPGTKPRWIEIEVRHPKDGSVVRLIAREVKEFWSERDSVNM